MLRVKCTCRRQLLRHILRVPDVMTMLSFENHVWSATFSIRHHDLVFVSFVVHPHTWIPRNKPSKFFFLFKHLWPAFILRVFQAGYPSYITSWSGSDMNNEFDGFRLIWGRKIKGPLGIIFFLIPQPFSSVRFYQIFHFNFNWSWLTDGLSFTRGNRKRNMLCARP